MSLTRLRLGLILILCLRWEALVASNSYPEIGDEIRSLKVWPEGDPIEKISDGEVVVLDFFAHWCGPCLGVSQALSQWEGDSSVRVIPINVEQRNPEKTIRFMEKAGLDEVYFDEDHSLSDKLGVFSLPLVALAKVEGDRILILDWFETFPGISHLAQRIEYHEAKERSGYASSKLETGQNQGLAKSYNRSDILDGEIVESSLDIQVIGAFERFSSSDIQISHTLVTAELDGSQWVNALSFSRNRSAIDYAPSSSDLIGLDAFRSEASDQVSLDLERIHNPRLSSLYSFSAYDGYTDFRSVWLDEFYRQQFEPVEGYEESDPQGYSISLGSRYEYLPASALLEVVAGFQFDQISPAYEAAPFQPLTRGLSEVDTSFVRASSENLLSPRLRMKQQLQTADTTERALRYSYQVDINYAATESLTVKGSFGLTRESSTFDSNHLGVAIERNLAGGFLFSLSGRRYEDSGEIVDPLILSTAAPALETTRYGMGLSWSGERLAFKLLAGRYRSDYDAVPPISFQFENLYRDRRWDYFRCSGSYVF